MAERLTIDLARMKPEGETPEGEADVIDLDEELVHPFGPVRYALRVQVFGTSEALVRGRLEQDFDLVCSRCGKDFDTTVKVEDFTASYEIDEKTDELDIGEDVREAILLELPNYPVCDENCEGVEQEEQGAVCAGALAAALEAIDESSFSQKEQPRSGEGS
ncbi:MAG: DUF177 domain-containing protein [Kiritimatiellae bacterium]|nr:DUF177 domain-containing protein [Kiritimatiellia bacterium]